jgi:hypothetical protein
MSILFKSLSVTFFVMTAVVLTICFMEVMDELPHFDLMLYGIMVCVGITGCVGAAVGISTIKEKG